jgi:hypothetical protein
MDVGGSGFGNILLFGVSGLVAQEVARQFKALDIAAGGRFGQERARSTFAANVALDQLIGGGFLKGVERSLNTRRDSRGLRPVTVVSGQINETRLHNYGLVNPSPLDIMFEGKTRATVRRR